MMETTLTNPSAGPTRTFPAPGTGIARLLTDPQYRRTFHAQLKTYNPWMVALYRAGLLPLFGVSRTVMLLITRGKKSGKLRYTPIGYFRIGGAIHLFSAWGKDASWYKNWKANPQDVWIQIGLRRRPVEAQALEDPAEIRRTLEQFIHESPPQAKYVLGWEAGVDDIDRADFSPFLDRVLIVRFTEQ